MTLLRLTVGHGFQSSMMVLTNLGNQTGHIQAKYYMSNKKYKSTDFIDHKSNSCHKIIYYMKI